MIVVGITGSFSSGKSAVADIFKKMGAKLFDADVAAKKVTRKGTAVHRAILQIFGEEYRGRDGEINRRKLAQHVFSYPRDLHKLNILIHPEVIFEAMRVIRDCKHKKGILALDVPLLYEARMERLAHVIVVVNSSQKKMIAPFAALIPSFLAAATPCLVLRLKYLQANPFTISGVLSVLASSTTMTS